MYTMVPITMGPPPGASLISIISRTLHSKWIGLSATRGGLTTVEGAGVSPANSNSLNPGSASTEEVFMAGNKLSVTIFTTNSLVARTLFNVSFLLPSIPRISGQNNTVGGLEHTTLKKENGARLGRPCRSRLEIQPMGRGRTEPVRIL